MQLSAADQTPTPPDLKSDVPSQESRASTTEIGTLTLILKAKSTVTIALTTSALRDKHLRFTLHELEQAFPDRSLSSFELEQARHLCGQRADASYAKHSRTTAHTKAAVTIPKA
jgi:hypothetical protein